MLLLRCNARRWRCEESTTKSIYSEPYDNHLKQIHDQRLISAKNDETRNSSIEKSNSEKTFNTFVVIYSLLYVRDRGFGWISIDTHKKMSWRRETIGVYWRSSRRSNDIKQPKKHRLHGTKVNQEAENRAHNYRSLVKDQLTERARVNNFMFLLRFESSTEECRLSLIYLN